MFIFAVARLRTSYLSDRPMHCQGSPYAKEHTRFILEANARLMLCGVVTVLPPGEKGVGLNILSRPS